MGPRLVAERKRRRERERKETAEAAEAAGTADTAAGASKKRRRRYNRITGAFEEADYKMYACKRCTPMRCTSMSDPANVYPESGLIFGDLSVAPDSHRSRKDEPATDNFDFAHAKPS